MPRHPGRYALGPTRHRADRTHAGSYLRTAVAMRVSPRPGMRPHGRCPRPQYDQRLAGSNRPSLLAIPMLAAHLLRRFGLPNGPPPQHRLRPSTQRRSRRRAGRRPGSSCLVRHLVNRSIACPATAVLGHRDSYRPGISTSCYRRRRAGVVSTSTPPFIVVLAMRAAQRLFSTRLSQREGSDRGGPAASAGRRNASGGIELPTDCTT